MTIQQLKYIISIYRHRSFARAADELRVTQPTLSSMVAKLEEELRVRLFERSNRRVVPTPQGEQIVAQAQRALREVERIGEMVAEHRDEASGRLALAVGPTVAPYILPQFIRRYADSYPQVDLSIVELKYETMVSGLLEGSLDAGIAISGNAQTGIDEQPLYAEPFWVYLSEQCWRKLPVFRPENLEHEQMWIMKEAQCLRESAFSFCKARSVGKRVYEAGSIETLIRIVDLNGGFTIIPEMHLPFLREEQRANVRRIDGDYLSQRRISLYTREGYARKRLLDTVTDTLRSFLPPKMWQGL